MAKENRQELLQAILGFYLFILLYYVIVGENSGSKKVEFRRVWRCFTVNTTASWRVAAEMTTLEHSTKERYRDFQSEVLAAFEFA